MNFVLRIYSTPDQNTDNTQNFPFENEFEFHFCEKMGNHSSSNVYDSLVGMLYLREKMEMWIVLNRQ